MAKENKEEKITAAAEENTVAENTSEKKLLEEAQAKADKIIAEAEEKAKKIISDAAPSGSGQTEKIPYEKRPEVLAEIARGEEKIPVKAIKDSGRYKFDLYIAVGEDNINLKRGKAVMIKRKFANVYEDSLRQDLKSDELIESLTSKSQHLADL